MNIVQQDLLETLQKGFVHRNKASPGSESPLLFAKGYIKGFIFESGMILMKKFLLGLLPAGFCEVHKVGILSQYTFYLSSDTSPL